MHGESTRRRTLRLIGTAAVAAVAPVAAAAPPAHRKRPAPLCPIAAPLDAIANRLLDHTPETAAYNGVAGALNGGPLARRLDDYSPAGEVAWRSALHDAASATAALACPENRRSRLQIETARAVLANATRSAPIPYGRINAFSFSGHVPYLVTQVAGPHIDAVNLMQTQQSLATPAAVDAWLTKLESFPAALSGIVEKLKADEAAGALPPTILIEKTKPVLAAFLAGPAADHPLIAALRTRMSAAGLDSRLRAKAEERAIALLEKRARPAFARLADHVAAMRTRPEDGLWAQPEGEALYAANVRALGDTTLSPDEIHATGVEEVRRISAQMEQRLAARGRRRGSIGDRMDALAREPAQRFADSDAGREALLAYVRTLVRQMEARYLQIVPPALIPQAQLEVRRVPPATEEGAPGGFYDGPSLDGTRPGTYWINLRDMDAVAKFRLPTLSYHEGVPGHHLQSSIALALGETPLLLRIASFNAYQEGWALYAERLAAEMGAYARDPLGDLGRLQDELFRAVRLVVDTGLHAKRWSRDRAIRYMRDVTGVAESRVTAEIERYMAWPGQALGYKLGQLRILDLRRRMAAARGKAFSRRAFHAAILGNGALPLDLVERAVLDTRA